MSKSVPSHSTRYSLRHLSPDFQWDTFPDFPSCDENPAEQFLSMQSQSPPPATERKSKEEKKRSSGAIPKSSAATKVQEPARDAVKLPSQENPSGLTAKQPLGTPPFQPTTSFVYNFRRKRRSWKFRNSSFACRWQS